MGRAYPRFLFSNPSNTKSKGPFIIHTLEPLVIIRISVKDPSGYPEKGGYLWTSDDDFIYEVVESKAESNPQAGTILGFAIEWFQNQDLDKASAFTLYEYTLLDNNGAVGFNSYYRHEVGKSFITYGYLYEVTQIEDDRIFAERKRVANPDDIEEYFLFGPQ